MQALRACFFPFHSLRIIFQFNCPHKSGKGLCLSAFSRLDVGSTSNTIFSTTLKYLKPIPIQHLDYFKSTFHLFRKKKSLPEICPGLST